MLFRSRLQDITNYIDCDINYSGKIDLRDAILVLQGLASINVGYLNTEVDLNGDGKIGIEEVIYIFQKVSKLR